MKYLTIISLILFSNYSYAYNRIELNNFIAEDIYSLVFLSANFMREYSANTNFESCGIIAYSKDDYKYSVRIFSDQVKIGCALYENDILNGYKLTNHIIHSHPHKKKVKLRKNDVAWSKKFTPYLNLKENQNIYLEFNHFSSLDMKYTGNSWLVTKDNIFLKNEKNEIINLKDENI